MPHAATTQFIDGLRASGLLDDADVRELEARPEAERGDVVSLSTYAQERGWLTAYQAGELREGRGHRLAVGGYHIFDKLDDGPAGITFKALHPALRLPVTLRVLRPDWLAPADTAADYLARVQSASLAQSPHLALVLDSGTHEDAPFTVQEFVDGCDLFHLVNEMGALPIGLACEYARQAAVALKAAHAWGVIHGEVSPFAMLLTPVKRATGSDGRDSVRPRAGATVKLVELGLTPVRPPLGEMTYGQSDRLGDVGFLPPERMTHSARTPAGDVYGLGATLFYLLTTRLPHAGDSPAATMLDLRQVEPPRVDSLRTEVPPALADLVGRLLSREPADRPSAADAAEALAPFCEPSATPPDAAGPVPLASETATIPSVPTADPVPKSTHAATAGEAEAPLVELLPEIQPLDEQYYADVGNNGHYDPFGRGGSSSALMIPRPRAKATRKNMVWIVAGLVLHLTAVALLIGYLTNWFSFVRPPEPERVEETKTSVPKTKTKPTS